MGIEYFPQNPLPENEKLKENKREMEKDEVESTGE